MKTTNKTRNLKSLSGFVVFCLFFVLALVSKEFLSKRAVLIVNLFDIGPENTPYAVMCVHFSVQTFYTLWQ